MMVRIPDLPFLRGGDGDRGDCGGETRKSCENVKKDKKMARRVRRKRYLIHTRIYFIRTTSTVQEEIRCTRNYCEYLYLTIQAGKELAS